MLKTIAATLIAFLSLAQASELDLTPGPDLTPQQVVEFQLRALKLNQRGEGIAATFRFASPNNKAVTGPLSKFSRLFDNPQYSPMLNHYSSEVKALAESASEASFGAALVDADGNVYWYRFDLSRQSQSPCAGCWMTDAVMRIKQPGRSA